MPREQQLKAVVKVQDQASKELKKIKASFKSFSKSAQGLTSSVGKLGALTLAPFAGGLAAGVAVLKSSISAMVEYGGSVDDTSKSLGIASDSLQAFRYAAQLGGSSAEGMDSAIAMLNKNISNAVNGKNKDLVGLMDHLGISMRDANGHMKTSAELMPEIAEAIKAQKDSTARATVAMAFFGKSGQDLIKTLGDGAEGLAKARKEAEHFGVIMSQDGVEASAEFGDSMTRTRYAIQGVQNSIGSKLLPILKPLLDDFNEWVAANREWIATTITESVKDFANALKDIDFKAIIADSISFIKASVQLFNKLGGLKTIGLAVAGVYGAKVVFAIGQVALAVKGFGLALMATPVGWICAGLAAIAVGAYLIIDNWDTVKKWLVDFWDWFKDTPLVALNPITIFAKLISENWDSIVSAFKTAKTSIGAVWDWFCDLPDIIKESWADLKTWFTDLFAGIGDSITSGMSSMKSALPNWAQKAIEYGGKAINLVSNAVSAPIPQVPLGNANGKGAVEVNIHAPEGYQAEVAKETSQGLKLTASANTGHLR